MYNTDDIAIALLMIIAIVTIICTIACLVGGVYGIVMTVLYHSADDLVMGILCFAGAFIFSTPIVMVVLD